MQSSFIQSITYQPPVILGWTMRPFSCWHGLMLEVAGSPYVCGGSVTEADMLYGVWVCRLGFSDGFKAATDIMAVKTWGEAQQGANLKDADAVFLDHIRLSLLTPKRKRSKDSEALRVPIWWHMAYFARHELGMADAEAWDYPFSRLIAYHECKAENDGDKALLTDRDIEMLALTPPAWKPDQNAADLLKPHQVVSL